MTKHNKLCDNTPRLDPNDIVPLGLPDDGDAVLLHLLPSPPSYSPLSLVQTSGGRDVGVFKSKHCSRIQQLIMFLFQI